MKGVLAWLLWCTAALAEEDLLKVGKTPAEKLEQQTAKAEDKLEEALQKYEHKKQLLTQTLRGQEGNSPTAALPDPTQADPEFQRAFRAMLRGAPTATGQQAAQPLLPKIDIAAKVKLRGHEPQAMLRIGGQNFLLRKSDSVTLLDQGQVVTVTVREITDYAVLVLVSPVNQVLTLR